MLMIFDLVMRCLVNKKCVFTSLLGGGVSSQWNTSLKLWYAAEDSQECLFKISCAADCLF